MTFSKFRVSILEVGLPISLRKTVGKVSPILVTLTSRSDSDFESSSVSLKENKPDGVNPNSNDITTTFERMKEKFYGFQQTALPKFQVETTKKWTSDFDYPLEVISKYKSFCQ